ncbi:MAG: carbamoyltransferase [Magnetococcales bacterium]|nr:carbamoyltransferase [Magnetococcales bacterium]NGZ26242.1 carbamoyltransferase [Magnetococcales bacterium]
MRILGLSAYYHDSAAALIVDGRILAAAQEERFSRKKHDSGFPKQALLYCLNEARINLGDLDYVAFYDKPFLKFERLLETYLAFAPRGFTSFCRAMPVWIKEKLYQKKMILDAFKSLDGQGIPSEKLLFSEHHQSHAASAFYPSPFQDAAVLTIDGVGEWATTSAGVGHGHQLLIQREIHFPHSLGLLYSAFTYFIGFKVNSGEYKVMGLAPYGEAKYTQKILDHLMDLKPDGSFRLNLKYFDYCTGLTMTNEAFASLFDGPCRKPEQPLSQREMDLAASIQAVTEEVVLRMTRFLAAETGLPNLCMAGGVALNCVANGKILGDGKFQNVWIQPAAGDAGGALGAALAAYHWHLQKPRHIVSDQMDAMAGSYLGPAFTQQQCEERLRAVGAHFTVLAEEELLNACAQALAEGKAVGWHQGRMEYGPRALGGRSILGDPRSPTMQKMLNLKVKYRESFRPFAPAVLRERVAEWFLLDGDSPYMLLVAGVHPKRRRTMTPEEDALFGIDKLNIPRSEIPAITHVDYSARIQTVHRETHPRYYDLILRFERITGCPVIVNTSFNVRGEPMVCTPEDSFNCFMGTEIDVLAVGNCMLYKEKQEPALKVNYENKFSLD